MSQNVKIGIVTAAGYTEADKYYGRLHGLLEAIKESTILTPSQKENLVVMGESFFAITQSYTLSSCDVTRYRWRVQLSLQIRYHLSTSSRPPPPSQLDPT